MRIPILNLVDAEKLLIFGVLVPPLGKFHIKWIIAKIESIKSIMLMNFRIQNILGQDIHSMILTSGTLSPFWPTIKEMEIPMPVTLSNSHVIERTQVYAKICRIGVRRITMDGRHKNW